MFASGLTGILGIHVSEEQARLVAPTWDGSFKTQPVLWLALADDYRFVYLRDPDPTFIITHAY